MRSAAIITMLLAATLPAFAQGKTGTQKTGTAQSGCVWKDPDSGLTWTCKDNGSDITWKQAKSYCSGLSLAGGGWRLPTIDELDGVYNASYVGDHIKGRMRPSGYFTWSGTLNGSSEARFIGFSLPPYQRQQSIRLGESDGLRAFCVRRSGK